MKKLTGFTKIEQELVVNQCKAVSEQLGALLNHVNGRIYAKHLDKLCRMANDINYFTDEFEHGYPVLEEPAVICPVCKNGIPAGELDYYRATCNECKERLDGIAP